MSLVGTTESSIRILALGQVLSLLLTGTGITSQALANRNVHIPTTQSLLNYFLLATLWFWRGRAPLKAAWWKYLLIAVADVEGNFLMVVRFLIISNLVVISKQRNL